MSEIYFEVIDDAVIKYTPMPEVGEHIYKPEVVMTKEIFQECYKKWIDPQASDCTNIAEDSSVSIHNAIIIPQNVTNGEMIKAMFPNVEVKEKNNVYEVYFGVGTAIQFFNHQWWNAKYKKESEGGKNDTI